MLSDASRLAGKRPVGLNVSLARSTTLPSALQTKLPNAVVIFPLGLAVALSTSLLYGILQSSSHVTPFPFAKAWSTWFSLTVAS